ncbi:MAG: hypothetical protein J6Q96_01325 [Bacteroidales bacterium]|nr:hypothetical protein [Bacteroidales bacterium]
MTKMKPHNKKPETLELENHMAYYTGTEHYYRYMGSRFVYTDGVRGFAQKAEAYWFIDLCFGYLVRLPEDFYSIKLTVKGGKATLTVKGEKEVARKNIPYTDCPEGEWLFYYSDNVLFWNGEY